MPAVRSGTVARVRAHIAALIVKEFVVDPQNAAGPSTAARMR